MYQVIRFVTFWSPNVGGHQQPFQKVHPKKVAIAELPGRDFLSLEFLVPPWKLTYPLKNDGWKMYFLLK